MTTPFKKLGRARIQEWNKILHRNRTLTRPLLMAKLQLTFRNLDIHPRYLCWDKWQLSLNCPEYTENGSWTFPFTRRSRLNTICTDLLRLISKYTCMQCRRMKFRSAYERPAKLEDLNHKHHRIMQNYNEITSSGFGATVPFFFLPGTTPVQLHQYVSRNVFLMCHPSWVREGWRSRASELCVDVTLLLPH